MARIEKLRAAFKECTGTFSWREFVNLLSGLGYEPVTTSKTGGPAASFVSVTQAE
jgi:hypothetical protein